MFEANPWLFHERPFNSEYLNFLKPTFRESYTQTIARFSNEIFLVVPDRVGNQSFTFFDFNQSVLATVERLANNFPDAVSVATLGTNTYEHLVYIFAILLSGKTLVPLNPDESRSFIQRKLYDGQIAGPVFTDTDRHCEFAEKMEIAPNATTSSHGHPLFPAKGTDFIYILSSGSTGISKFVRQTEIGVLCNVEALIRHHNLQRRKTISTSLPIFHVNGLEFSVFCSFFSGGKLILWNKFDAHKVLSSSYLSEVEIYSSIPALIEALCRLAAPGQLQNLNYFVSAATYLSTRVTKLAIERHSKIVIQGYGLSEAVNFSCLVPVEISLEDYRDLLISPSHPSIGIEVWGNTIDVRSDKKTLCEEGEVGEFFIRGYNVMSGYRNSNQVAIDPVYGLATGDLGYFRIRGGQKFFFMESRKKDTIKKNGLNIGLRDIDEHFADLCEQGLECIAVPFDNSLRGEEVGLVIRSESCTPHELERLLRNRLSELAEHRRPKVVIRVFDEALRTPSGKPLRWKFTSLFSRYEQTVVFSKMKIQNAESES